MSEMTPGLYTAIGGDRPVVFGAIEINLPGYDLCLLDRSGELMIGGKKFVGCDPTYGTIAAIDNLTDGTGDDAPTLTLTIQAPSSTSAAVLGAEANQDSRVRISLGVVDRFTGIVVPDPVILFDGELDVPTLQWGMRRREVDFTVVSVFEKFFDLEEGIRLCDSWHQSVWPGEYGCAFITGVTATVPWGTSNIGAITKK